MLKGSVISEFKKNLIETGLIGCCIFLNVCIGDYEFLYFYAFYHLWLSLALIYNWE